MTFREFCQLYDEHVNKPHISEKYVSIDKEECYHKFIMSPEYINENTEEAIQAAIQFAKDN